MGWDMYRDGVARYNMRVSHQITVRDCAFLIARDTNKNGKRETFEQDEDGNYQEVTKEWTKKGLEEKIRTSLERFGYDEIRSQEESLDEEMNPQELEEHIEMCKSIIADKYNIDNLREDYGYEPKYREKGGTRYKEVNVQSHIRKTSSGKPTKVKTHQRSRPRGE